MYNISARVICDRGVSHEIVRHRLASYSQESTRYCNYKGGVTFIIPCWLSDIKEGEYGEEFFNCFVHADKIEQLPLSWGARLWMKAMDRAEQSYLYLLKISIIILIPIFKL